MAAAAEISAMLNHLAASAERDPPARRLRSPTARPGLEALAGALAAGPPTDPAAARAVLSAARAVVSAVLPTLGVTYTMRLSLVARCPYRLAKTGKKRGKKVGGGMVVAGCHGEERKSNEVNWEAARLSFLLGHPRQFRHHGCYSSAHRFQSSC